MFDCLVLDEESILNQPLVSRIAVSEKRMRSPVDRLSTWPADNWNSLKSIAIERSRPEPASAGLAEPSKTASSTAIRVRHVDPSSTLLWPICTDAVGRM